MNVKYICFCTATLNYIYSVRTAQKTHSVSVIKINQLMLYREIIAVCSEIHTKHINTLCGQNVELWNVKLGGTYSDHWASYGKSVSSYINSLLPTQTHTR
jgi:hypothetical protein